MWANESTHVFNNSQNIALSLLAEWYLFPDIRYRNFLRGCHDHNPIIFSSFDILNYWDVLVRCPGRWINDQVVKLSPGNGRQKLLDYAIFSWASSNNRIIRTPKHKAYWHNPKVVLCVNRLPSIITLVHLISFKAKHSRDARTANINI